MRIRAYVWRGGQIRWLLEPLGRGAGLGGVVDHPGTRVTEAEARKERALAGLGDLELKGRVAVEHVDADVVEIREVVEGVEDRVGMSARPCRGAEHDGIGALADAGIEDEVGAIRERVGAAGD